MFEKKPDTKSTPILDESSASVMPVYVFVPPLPAIETLSELSTATVRKFEENTTVLPSGP